MDRGFRGRQVVARDRERRTLRRSEQMEIKRAGLLREPDVYPVSRLAIEACPGSCAVNALAVRLQPGAEAFQPRDLLRRNLRVHAARADIQQQIAVLRHHIDEAAHELIDGFIVSVRVVAVEAEGMAHALRRFPLLFRDLVEGGVFRRAEIAMRRHLRNDAARFRLAHPRLQHAVEPAAHEFEAQQQRAPASRHPAVVHNAVVLRIVIVGEQLQLAAERRGPGNVVPQDGGLVTRDQLARLRVGIGGIIAAGRRAGEIAQRAQRLAVERPVYAAGVIDAEFQAGGAHGRRQLAHHVALGRPVLLMWILHCTRPQAEAVMVLGDENDIARAGGSEGGSPFRGLPLLERFQERLTEAFIRRIAIGRFVEFRAVAFRHLDGVPVPFAIGRLGDGDVVSGAESIGDGAPARRESGDREQAPMDEDAELGVLIPFGHGMGVERRKRRRIGHAATLEQITDSRNR